MGIKVDIIARDRIKPPSPTPNHLRNLKLSLLDQIIPPMYGLIVFFFPANTKTKNISEISGHLKKSLSQTLTSFYPLAGRLNTDDPSIFCNDEGAFFVEATMDCKLDDFFGQAGSESLNHFLPTNDPQTSKLAVDCLALVQLTGFQCGGMAISVCLSHKFGDISSLITFLHGWTSCSRDDGEKSSKIESPIYIGDSLFPPRDLSFMSQSDVKSVKTITKRFIFEASKIASLKDKVGSIGEKHPSRVEVVLALILKCSMAASKTVKGSFVESVLFHAMNLRPRMSPPLPENSIGNLIWFLPIVIEESEMDLSIIVSKMRREINEFCEEKASKLKDDEGLAVLGEISKWGNFKEMELFSCSSWCKFPLYETDFGWGKPKWVSSASLAFKNSIILVDTKQGDGIEAWVTLEEENMSIFELDKELLDSSSRNPSPFASNVTN
ncbi:hypothetical protein UlMin_040075 [Ulmus minor]